MPENDLHQNSWDTNIKSNCSFHDNYFTQVQYLQVTATNNNYSAFICLKRTSTKLGVRSKTILQLHQ